MIERMNGLEKVGYYNGVSAGSGLDADFLEALAEHYAISKTPNARGLKMINTERATVPMRCVVMWQEAECTRKLTMD